MNTDSLTRIAIFASGTGTNAENIIRNFSDSVSMKVVLVLSNRKNAPVLEKAERLGVETYTFNKAQLQDGNEVLNILKEHKVNLVVLAGFLLKIPESLLKAFPDHIINIHPSLLPRHGGPGMFGANVHEKVISSGDRISGITVHLVNEDYDRGNVLFQAQCEIDKNETATTLAAKVHQLEHEHFPRVVRDYAMSESARSLRKID